MPASAPPASCEVRRRLTVFYTHRMSTTGGSGECACPLLCCRIPSMLEVSARFQEASLRHHTAYMSIQGSSRQAHHSCPVGGAAEGRPSIFLFPSVYTRGMGVSDTAATVPASVRLCSATRLSVLGLSLTRSGRVWSHILEGHHESRRRTSGSPCQNAAMEAALGGLVPSDRPCTQLDIISLK